MAKEKVSMMRLAVEWKGQKTEQFPAMYSTINGFIEEQKKAAQYRADEAFIRSDLSTDGKSGLLIVVVPMTQLMPIRSFIKKFRGKITSEAEYHRVPYGDIHRHLTTDLGYAHIGKFVGEHGESFMRFRKVGKPTILVHMPTFLVFQMQGVDLGLARAGQKQPA